MYVNVISKYLVMDSVLIAPHALLTFQKGFFQVILKGNVFRHSLDVAIIVYKHAVKTLPFLTK